MNDIKEKLDNIFTIMASRTLLIQNKESRYSVEELIKEYEKIDSEAKESILKIIEDELNKCQELVNKLAQLNIDNHRYSREIANQPN